MTIFENIAFPLRVRHEASAEIRRKVHDVLELIRLPDVADRKPAELSGGQQQRISLARCIVYNPALILLDEPLGALDRKLREQMQLEIKRIHGELGITMLNVTHDQDEALTMSDRIILMNRGNVEQDSAPEDLYFRPRSVFAADFVGDANLLLGQVVECGDVVRVSTGFGALYASRPDAPVSVGSTVAAMVRPENVRFEDGSTGGANSYTGVLQDSIVLGGIVKHYVRLADTTRLIVQEPNHRRRRPLVKGDDVNVTWSEHDCMLLPAAGFVSASGSNARHSG
jgi:putative spermidine/putrescine transport system ATP-binding protein